MAVKLTYEDKCGVVHEDAYANLQMIFFRKVSGNVILTFEIFAGESQRIANKQPVDQVSIELTIEDFLASSGEYAYNELKKLPGFKQSQDA